MDTLTRFQVSNAEWGQLLADTQMDVRAWSGVGKTDTSLSIVNERRKRVY
jgi:hypothetical protein